MSGFPFELPSALRVARDVVDERYPEVECAWLSGSVVAGWATATSDLDIVVLLAGSPAPLRESLVIEHSGHHIPVELFVHTARSVRHYVGKDRERSQPSMARMIADGIALVDVSKAAHDLVIECRSDLEQGPEPLSRSQIDAQRYAVTGLLEDLRGASSDDERAVLAASLWEAATRLLLGVDRAWQGAGKGLVRAARERDAGHGDGLGGDLIDGLVARDDRQQLDRAVCAVLDHVGGPLFDGYRLGGETS